MNKALVVVDAAIAQFKHTRLMTHIQAGAVVGDIVPKDHLCGHQQAVYAGATTRLVCAVLNDK